MIPFVIKIMTSKVTFPVGPWTVITIFGFPLILGLLGLLFDVTVNVERARTVHGAELSALVMCALWFASRQASLARALWKRGLTGYWLTNGASAIDTLIIASVGCVVTRPPAWSNPIDRSRVHCRRRYRARLAQALIAIRRWAPNSLCT